MRLHDAVQDVLLFGREKFLPFRAYGLAGDPVTLLALFFQLGLIVLSCHQLDFRRRSFILLLEALPGFRVGDAGAPAQFRELALLGLVNERDETELDARVKLGFPLLIGFEVREMVSR